MVVFGTGNSVLTAIVVLALVLLLMRMRMLVNQRRKVKIKKRTKSLLGQMGQRMRTWMRIQMRRCARECMAVRTRLKMRG